MEERLSALVCGLPAGIDGVLLFSELPRFYYTGFRSDAGVLLAWRGGAEYIVDFRYIEAARRAVRHCGVTLQGRLYEQLDALCAAHGLHTLAVDGDYLTLQRFEGLCARLQAKLVYDPAVCAAMVAQRKIKTADELACIRQAQEITDRSFAYILDYIRPGRTEREIALELEFYSRRLGSEEAAFDFIAVAGANGSLPHGVPTDRPVCAGEMLTLDFGATVGGYRSDMTRTVAVGRLGEEERRVYETVLAAQKAALAVIGPGVPCREVDAAARTVIEEQAGYQGCFGHALGHSVGLEIHEEPRFSPSCDELCQPGIVMTVEPGVYLEGKCGCRIEDMVVLTETGYENLTKSPKELIELC